MGLAAAAQRQQTNRGGTEECGGRLRHGDEVAADLPASVGGGMDIHVKLTVEQRGHICRQDSNSAGEAARRGAVVPARQ